MKKFLFQSILLLFIIAVGFIFYAGNFTSNKTIALPFLPQATKVSSLKINGVALNVEIADTPQKRNKGLGGRESIATDAGMLFIFDKPQKHPFWMKGLAFPLDFIWIRGDTIVDLLPNVPPPTEGQDDKNLPIYTSKVEVDKVLEVNRGVIQRLNIRVGDVIKLE